MIRVKVDDGKYEFFVPEGDYRIHITRCGEPWVVIEAGSKAVFNLMAELEEARERIANLQYIMVGEDPRF